MTAHQHQILALDVAGNPRKWLTHEKAIFYHAKDLVAWSIGDNLTTYHGGTRRCDGERSVIHSPPIIAIRGSDFVPHAKINKVALTNDTLFLRDRHICAYCGDRHTASNLSRDHVKATSRGGENTWMNCVTACRPCNTRKSDSHVGEKWKLLYVPYEPVKAEALLLDNRRILFDQMDFLLASIPKHSRVYQDLPVPIDRQ